MTDDDDDDDDDDDLFSFKGPPPEGVRRTDPDTSHEAADDEKAIGALEAQYLEALRDHPPGLASIEVSRIHYGDGRSRDSYSPRAKQLERRGLVEPAGKRMVENERGKVKPLIAYRLTPKGWALFGIIRKTEG